MFLEILLKIVGLPSNGDGEKGVRVDMEGNLNSEGVKP